MKSVLLVGPSMEQNSRCNWAGPHLGLHRLAAYLRHETGAEVELVDPSMECPQFAGWDCIGFSPIHHTLAADIAMMQRARFENPACLLVAGGVEATLNPGVLLSHTDIDFIITGEGERPLAQLLSGEPLSGISGLIYRRRAEPTSGEQLLEAYRNMDFGAMGYETYWEQTASLYESPPWSDIRTVRLVTSTHCNRNCAFCSSTRWHRTAVGRHVPTAYIDADGVLSLIRKIESELPAAEKIYFCDDDFCFLRERIEQICAKSKGARLSYIVQSHISDLDADLLDTLSSGGVVKVNIGVENASQRILNDLNKPQDISRVPMLIEESRRRGITLSILLILFTPTVTVDDLRLNLRVARKWMDSGAIVSIEPYTWPLTGTTLVESRLHQIEYSLAQIPMGGSIKIAERILPDDPEARKVLETFTEVWNVRLATVAGHRFKAAISMEMLDVLEQVLEGHE